MAAGLFVAGLFVLVSLPRAGMIDLDHKIAAVAQLEAPGSAPTRLRDGRQV